MLRFIRPEVLENINRIAAEQELLVPDVPVYGDGLFDSEYAAAHTEELLGLYSALLMKNRARPLKIP